MRLGLITGNPAEKTDKAHITAESLRQQAAMSLSQSASFLAALGVRVRRMRRQLGRYASSCFREEPSLRRVSDGDSAGRDQKFHDRRVLNSRKWTKSIASRLIMLCVTFFLGADYLIFTFNSLSWPNAAPTYTTPSSSISISGNHPALIPSIKKVYISATHWNSGAILQTHWSAAILDLIRILGPQNVYVSIYESGSWDNTKDLLRGLEKQLNELGVENTIVLDETTHTEIVNRPEPPSISKAEGWVRTPRGRREVRRIPYLASVRNESLKPLKQLNQIGRNFDRLIFLNDVIFTTADVINLLNTRNGTYAAACAMDFARENAFYDSFALRDLNGKTAYSSYYPYITSRLGRTALSRGEAFPVQSCWNGIAVFDAAPFQVESLAKSSPSNAIAERSPLRFRAIADSLAARHVEGSECCLIHYDNPRTKTKGVWVNPHVRVGYNAIAHASVRSFPKRSESLFGWFWSMLASVMGLPWRNGKIDKEVALWRAEDKNNYEPGVACLSYEMQVLVWNGWAHSTTGKSKAEQDRATQATEFPGEAQHQDYLNPKRSTAMYVGPQVRSEYALGSEPGMPYLDIGHTVINSIGAIFSASARSRHHRFVLSPEKNHCNWAEVRDNMSQLEISSDSVNHARQPNEAGTYDAGEGCDSIMPASADSKHREFDSGPSVVLTDSRSRPDHEKHATSGASGQSATLDASNSLRATGSGGAQRPIESSTESSALSSGENNETGSGSLYSGKPIASFRRSTALCNDCDAKSPPAAPTTSQPVPPDSGDSGNLAGQYPSFMKPKFARAPIREAGRVAYLGESSNLSLLVHDKHGLSDVVHYPLPDDIRGPRARLCDLDNLEIDILHQRGAFLLPPRSLCDELVEAYFTWVAPVVPIINRSRFMRRYHDPKNPPSLLLLQAILLAGCRVCTNPQLMDAGGSTTPAAMTFYKRAKALYDANYEDDRVTIVQALVLMGWYWEGPEGNSLFMPHFLRYK
ncbi:hypothetical protein KEM54_000842, partial [Ascosphaera aggregata]